MSVNSRKYILEVIASSVEDAIAAEAGGADRLELVSALSEGGLTPSLGLTEAVIKAVSIPVNVMLRPHSESFVYSPHDYAIMRKDLRFFEEIGVGQVVVGALEVDGSLAGMELAELISSSRIPLTFHRAIDASKNPVELYGLLSKYPQITHVLTSGGPGKATDNIEILKQLLSISGPRLILGSGVSEATVGPLLEALAFPDCEIHVGTAVRGGKVHAGVAEAEVRHFRELLDRFNKAD